MKQPSRLLKALVAAAVSLVLFTCTMQTARASDPGLAQSANPELYAALHAAPYNLDPDGDGLITAAEMAGLTGELDLRSSGLKSVEGIQYAININVLALVGNNDLTGIAQVSNMANLEKLYISYTGVTKLPADMSRMENLYFLSCSWTPLDESATNKNAILSLPKLQAYDANKPFTIVLSNFTDMSFLSPAAAPGLAMLLWDGYPGRGASNFVNLASLTQLKGLCLSSDSAVGAPGSTVLGTIAEHLPGLTTLGLQQCSLTDIGAVSGMTDLTFLILTDNQIQDISALSGMVNLECLLMDKNYISDLAPLAGKAKLDTIVADENYLDPTPGSADRAVLDEIGARGFAGVSNQRKTTVHFDAAPYASPADVTTYYGANVALPAVAGLPAGKAADWDTDGDGVAEAPAGGTAAFTWPVLPIPAGEVTYKAYFKDVDTNCQLTGIALSPAQLSLSPAFSPSQPNYTVKLPLTVGSVTVTPAKPAKATMTIDGAAVASKTVALGYGQSKTLVIAVTAESGDKTTYRVTVSRAKTDAYRLLSLGNNRGTLSPAFSPYKTGYTLTLPEGAGSVTLKPTKAVASSKLYINNKLTSSRTFTLAAGKSTKATVKVVAGGKSCTYTVTIKRKPSTNANLKSLSAGYALTPRFAPGVTAYTVKVPDGRGSVTVKAAKADANATVTINGAKAASKTITIKNGQSVTVTVVVKAQAGNKKIYRITLKRPPHISSFTASPVAAGYPTVQGGKPVTFRYALAGAGGAVKLEVYAGGAWQQMLARNDGAGTRMFSWNGKLGGAALAPGKYTVRLTVTAAGYSVTKTMTVAVK